MSCDPHMLATMPLADMPVDWIWIVFIAISVLGGILKRKDPDKEKGASKSSAPGPPLARPPSQTPQRRVPTARPAERRMVVAPPPPRPVPAPPASEPYTVESLRKSQRAKQPAPATIASPAVGTIEADSSAPARPRTCSANSAQAMLVRTLTSRSTLRSAIILSEILGPPKALRGDDV